MGHSKTGIALGHTNKMLGKAHQQPGLPFPAYVSLTHFGNASLGVHRLRSLRFESLAALDRSRIVSATISELVSDGIQTRRYFVSGTVQGVGFRFFVQRVAEKLELGGYARNLFDGRVEVLAVGTAAKLAELRRALEQGPRFASVSGVHEEETQPAPRYASRFVIEPNA